MIKVVSLVVKKSGISQKEFEDYWLNQHAPLVLKVLPQIKKYAIDTLVTPAEAGAQQYSGVADLYFDDLESWERTRKFIYEDPGGQILRDDDAKFLDLDKCIYFVTQENLIKELKF